MSTLLPLAVTPDAPVVVHPMLPYDPSPGEWARRFVRHGLADVLRWLGEPVGPPPDEQTHALAGWDPAFPRHPQVFMVSQELFDRLRAEGRA